VKAYWTESTERSVRNEAQLASVIAEVLALDEPTMLFLEHEVGSTLIVGIGANETVLTFVESDSTSFHSIGDKERVGVLKFWCRDQVDDFLAEMAIPTTSGIDAAKYFLAKGQKPQNVTWEPDW
jgi:hypothetical protein